MNDREFRNRLLADYEAAGSFRHRQHLHMAWSYLRRDGAERGAENAVAFVRHVAEAHGDLDKYNETMTRFWIGAVGAAQTATGTSSFEELLERHPQVLDKELPFRHWSRETLTGAEAKAGWVDPDRAPLPSLVYAGPV